MAHLRFAPSGALDGLEEDLELLDLSLGHDGTVTTLWLRKTEREAATARVTAEHGAVFPVSRSARPISYVVHLWHPAGQRVIRLDPCDAAFPFVARLASTGHILIVGARCAVTREGPEYNAFMFDDDGTLVRRGVMGDGISHVCVDATDSIWAGYFDEGIFGNFGWGGDGPEPLGSPGIVRFNSRFDVTWAAPQTAETAMADVYAMTTHGADVIACPYDSFRLLMTRDGTLEARGQGAPCNQLLVLDDAVALFSTHPSTAPPRVVHLTTGDEDSLDVTVDGYDKTGPVATCGDKAVTIIDRAILFAQLAL